jgi:hypothetical protein
MKRLRWLALALPLWLAACPAPQSDPPPPPRKAEIPSAPPHALGALAGGTDAAPRPEAAPPGEPGLLPPGGISPKNPSAAPEPESPGDAGAPLSPDAGMAL